MVAAAAAGTLLAVWSASAAEKVQTLATKSASWHPVMLVSRRRRELATILIGVGLGLELLTLAALVVDSRVGGGLSLVLVSIYSYAGLPVYRASGRSQSSCRCLFGLLDAKTRAAFLLRNGVVALLAGLAIGGTPTFGVVSLALALAVLTGLQLSINRLNRTSAALVTA